MSKEKRSLQQLRVLLVDNSDQRRAAVEAALTGVDCTLVGVASIADDLLEAVQRCNPDVVIIDADAPGRDTLESLESVQSCAPRPIVMFTQDDNGSTIRRATQAGVSAYVVDGIQPRRVRPILEAAISRFQAFRTLHDELERTRTHLEERKVIERAKGVLMRQRGMDEEGAYQALRKVAMDSNRRLAEVAKGVADAAELLL